MKPIPNQPGFASRSTEFGRFAPRPLLAALLLAAGLGASAGVSAGGVALVATSTVASKTSAEPEQAMAEIAVRGQYLQTAHDYLSKIARYPTGRESSLQRPEGKATVWFELDRSGAIKSARLEKSSASMLLDGAALSTVRRGTYPAFPDAYFPGEASMGFNVTFDYRQQ
jgi:protein TonB